MELPGKRELREQILHQMDGRTSYVSDKDVYREIDKAILRSSHGGYGTLSEKEELRRQMFYSIRGFDVLEKYLGDSSISEIMQFRTDSYQKLSLILIQSFTKGGREAAMLMEAEEREAFHKRIDRAKKEGEEASTRLLFPMILLLCQVMLLVMYPALTRFQGF